MQPPELVLWRVHQPGPSQNDHITAHHAGHSSLILETNSVFPDRHLQIVTSALSLKGPPVSTRFEDNDLHTRASPDMFR